MRALGVVVAWATVGILVTAPLPVPGDAGASGVGYQALYQRSHARAVELLHERDDLQTRLAGRVRENRALRRALVHQPSSLEALHLAAIAYGVPFELEYRIASCESTGTDPDHSPVSERSLYARAKNAHSTARGLGQFLDSTWASTPYAGFDVYSPYANALAIANEIRHGNAGWQWAASAGCWR